MRTYQLGNGLVFTILLLILSVTAFPVQSKNQQYEAELDQMLAPIALYPDSILTHILIAATYPLEVVQASRWLAQHPELTGEEAIDAAEHQDWDPSVKALLAFPLLLQRLNDDLTWTQRLGDVFLEDEPAMLASIQRLRKQAYAHGSLKQMEHVVIEREREIIVIEPARREVVYVPVYDTRVVYGTWWWPSHPPIFWHYPAAARSTSYFYWSSGYRLGPSFYFSTFDWHRHHVIVHHHYYHRPPTYYPKRHHFQHANRWQHDHYHRRGVHYRHPQVSEQYSRRADRSHSHEQPRSREQWRSERQQATTPAQSDRFIPRESRLRDPQLANRQQQSESGVRRQRSAEQYEQPQTSRYAEYQTTRVTEPGTTRRDSRMQQARQQQPAPEQQAVVSPRPEHQTQPVSEYRTERRNQTAHNTRQERRSQPEHTQGNDDRTQPNPRREQRANLNASTRPEQHTQPITMPRERPMAVSRQQESAPAAMVSRPVERVQPQQVNRQHEPRPSNASIGERSARFENRRSQQEP